MAARLKDLVRYIDATVGRVRGYELSSRVKVLTRRKGQYGIRLTEPFSHLNAFTQADRDCARQRLQELGMMELPLFFNSALAIASDIDGSTRAKYLTYTRLLTRDYGLDFGDSIWLNRVELAVAPGKAKGRPRQVGLGFLPPYDSSPDGDDPNDMEEALFLDDLVHEYHAGNLDHWHGILARGGTGIVLNAIHLNGPAIELHDIKISGEDNSKKSLPVMGVCLSFDGDPLEVESVRLLSGGRYHRYINDLDAAANEGVEGNRTAQHQLYRFEPNGTGEPPSMAEIDSVEISLTRPDLDRSRVTVSLVSHHGSAMLASMRRLQDRYNVEFGTITAHGGHLFFNDKSLAHHSRRYGDLYKGQGREHRLLRSEVCGPAQVFSALIDRPSSHMFALPDLVRDLDVRFVNSAGLTAAPDRYFDVWNIIGPSKTRCAQNIYIARRTMPTLDETSGLPEEQRRRSRQSTVSARLARALRHFDGADKQVCALYTHLGGTTEEPDPDTDVGSELPNPYIDPVILGNVQDRVYNNRGAQDDAKRIWFTRLSVLYDYAYMVRMLPDNTTRISTGGTDIVSIASWDDPHLGKRFPLSPSQLYGVTFLTEDPESIRIFLDGGEIGSLVRLPGRDGRPAMVMIAETDLSIPATNAIFQGAPTGRVEGSNAQLTWDPGGFTRQGPEFTAPHFELKKEKLQGRPVTTVPKGWMNVRPESLGSVRWPLGEQDFLGCQHLALRLFRSHAGTALCIKIKTADSGMFLFHTPDFETEPDYTARFVFEGPAKGVWKTVVLPFYEMQWTRARRDRAPLPTKRVTEIELSAHNASASEAIIGIDRLDFERPRATRVRAESAEHVITGQIKSAEAGGTVTLAPAGDRNLARTTTANRNGSFTFTDVPTGVYGLRAEPSGDAVFVYVKNDCSLLQI